MYLMQRSVGCCFSPYSQTRYAFSDGRNRSKDTIAVLICANMDEKMPLLVSGKYEKSRCFEHCEVLLCTYIVVVHG
jgi:hypothetical protein